MKQKTRLIATMMFSVFAIAIALALNSDISSQMKLGQFMLITTYSIFQILSYIFVFRGNKNE